MGVYTEAIKDDNGLRVGFEAVNLDGSRRTLAHKSQFMDSPDMVGGKSGGIFFVDTDAISSFILPAIHDALGDKDAVIIIDEIGKIQACNAEFLPLMQRLLDSDHDVLGTIVFDPEPWAEKIKNDPRVILLALSKENRDALPQILEHIFSWSNKLEGLDAAIANRALALLREYLEKGQSIQIEKLFSSALDYVRQPLPSRGQDESGNPIYDIRGKHDVRIVTAHLQSGTYLCTCPLNRGEGRYVGQAGECSHIQTVKMLLDS